MERTLAKAAAWALLLGFLTGVYAAAAAGGMLPVDARSALAAHLNALIGGLLLLGVAYSLQFLRYGPQGKSRLGWAFIVAVYANWLLTAVKAALHVRSINWTGEPANDAVYVALLLLVIAPSLGGAAAWAAGFSNEAQPHRAPNTRG